MREDHQMAIKIERERRETINEELRLRGANVRPGPGGYPAWYFALIDGLLFAIGDAAIVYLTTDVTGTYEDTGRGEAIVFTPQLVLKATVAGEVIATKRDALESVSLQVSPTVGGHGSHTGTSLQSVTLDYGSFTITLPPEGASRTERGESELRDLYGSLRDDLLRPGKPAHGNV
jgi:hypothetical protein